MRSVTWLEGRGSAVALRKSDSPTTALLQKCYQKYNRVKPSVSAIGFSEVNFLTYCQIYGIEGVIGFNLLH